MFIRTKSRVRFSRYHTHTHLLAWTHSQSKIIKNNHQFWMWWWWPWCSVVNGQGLPPEKKWNENNSKQQWMIVQKKIWNLNQWNQQKKAWWLISWLVRFVIDVYITIIIWIWSSTDPIRSFHAIRVFFFRFFQIVKNYFHGQILSMGKKLFIIMMRG